MTGKLVKKVCGLAQSLIFTISVISNMPFGLRIIALGDH